LANLAATIALITHDASGPQPWTARTQSFDGTLCHELLESRRFVPLTWCEDDGHQLALAFGPDMDFGAEAALTAP
jgi:hypothetical protein